MFIQGQQSSLYIAISWFCFHISFTKPVMYKKGQEKEKFGEKLIMEINIHLCSVGLFCCTPSGAASLLQWGQNFVKLLVHEKAKRNLVNGESSVCR